jgi:hypothetical protein
MEGEGASVRREVDGSGSGSTAVGSQVGPGMGWSVLVEERPVSVSQARVASTRMTAAVAGRIFRLGALNMIILLVVESNLQEWCELRSLKDLVWRDRYDLSFLFRHPIYLFR